MKKETGTGERLYKAFIYLVLGILYESFIHPLTILSGLPSAGFGALFTLWIFGQPLDLYGFVGVIMLLGIVKKNAIMMTTMAALMGALPIAIGMGAGAEARRPLGLAVVGGLCFSQLVTLYITPVYYAYMEDFSRWLTGRFGQRFEANRAARAEHEKEEGSHAG